MRSIPLSTTALSLLLAVCGCVQVPAPPAVPPASVTSWGPLGGFAMSSGTTCSGHVLLNGRTATTTDQCFSGPADIVLCTDTTAANPVMCTPASGYLVIGGTPGDTIAYARIR
ncbi:MAG TPA: hypothetical protein VMF50_11660 [Candidatus Binataceae bacterium]|nr:hypothetical protein [Candidatus Binataceae bacterium]